MSTIVEAWLDIVRRETAGLDDAALLQRLQSRVQATISYEQQPLNDTWQLPHETLGKRAGNCNDIAGLKFFTLGHLLPLDQWLDGVRMIQVRLTDFPRGADGHMVCGFVTGGETLVLDNRAGDEVYLLSDTSRNQVVVAQSSSAHFRIGEQISSAVYDRFDRYLAQLSEYPQSGFFMPGISSG